MRQGWREVERRKRKKSKERQDLSTNMTEQTLRNSKSKSGLPGRERIEKQYLEGELTSSI